MTKCDSFIATSPTPIPTPHVKLLYHRIAHDGESLIAVEKFYLVMN